MAMIANFYALWDRIKNRDSVWWILQRDMTTRPYTLSAVPVILCDIPEPFDSSDACDTCGSGRIYRLPNETAGYHMCRHHVFATRSEAELAISITELERVVPEGSDGPW